MESDNCGNCSFSQFIDSAYVHCRCFPPLPTPIRVSWLGKIRSEDMYPIMERDQWCGEWRPGRQKK